MRVRASIGWVIVLVIAALGASAEKPKIDGIFPAGGQRGTEFDVSVIGTIKPWPLQAACDDPRITFAPSEKEKGKYRVKVAAEVEAGAYLVRFFNKDGATDPRQFVVGLHPERAQSGTELMTIPADEFPLTVNGKLDSAGDVDRFAVKLQRGQVLVAEVAAYAMDSPLDPLLHVRGPRGEQLAFNHDATGLGLDPRLVFMAPEEGTYEVQLSAFAYPPKADIRFTGGASSIYRLTFGHRPPTIDLPAPHEAKGEEPQAIRIPATISGTIDPAGDTDRYRFTAKKGEVLRFEVAAAELGSWMDAVLVIRDSAGKELKRQDDIDSKTQHDVALDWTVPADGEFIGEVLDLNREGGSEIAYQFRTSKPAAHFMPSANSGVYAITGGAKLEIAVKVARRYGHKGELEVGIEGLPPGVTAASVVVSDKGEAKLGLEAAADAAPANVPITIWVGPVGEVEKRVRCRFDLKGAAADAGDLLINHTERGWLTVIAKK